jgi:hypothetical protein
MAEGRLILGLDVSSASFLRSLKAIKDQQLQREIRQTLKELLFLDLDQAPRKLHLHQLGQKKVPSATRVGVDVNPWTVHVTANDLYKVSFTLEDGIAYFRHCDEHDRVDKHP